MDIQVGDKFLYVAGHTVYVITGKFEHDKEIHYRIRAVKHYNKVHHNGQTGIRTLTGLRNRVARGSWVHMPMTKHIVPLR